MPDRYIPGVPCWVDTSQPDPEGATKFYGGLFGWEFEDVLPDSDASYFIARLPDGMVGAVGSIPESLPQVATWNTYVWVESADETAAKAKEAGGSILMEPFDVMDAGRMAVFADPEGAMIAAWQPMQNKGSEVVNEHGSVNFHDLHTRDADGAKPFYRDVFGWGVLDLGGAEMWTLEGYGDHLESLNPGTRERMGDMGAPAGFEDVVASLQAIPDDQPDTPPHWGVTFAVEDADEIAAKVPRLGGEVLVPPFDAPWVRMSVIRDPQGATFNANQFVPENKDLPAAADAGAA
jgi:predicted enzyme related to lactoylglutathione lyase